MKNTARGRFLVDIFEDWVRHDVGRVYVQLFDVTLEAYFGRHLLCMHAPTCGYGPALEHNGDLYSCDHFVEPRYRLGNTNKTHLLKLVTSPEQRKFGNDKRDSLTALCAGLELFFTHTRPAMQTMAQLFQRGLPPSDIMAMTAAEDEKGKRNQPCPCGSGRRFHSCHGNKTLHSPFSGLGPVKDRPLDGSVEPVQAESTPHNV